MAKRVVPVRSPPPPSTVLLPPSSGLPPTELKNLWNSLGVAAGIFRLIIVTLGWCAVTRLLRWTEAEGSGRMGEERKTEREVDRQGSDGADFGAVERVKTDCQAEGKLTVVLRDLLW